MSTHKELISSLKFNEAFKSTLRNYYTYGFMKTGDDQTEREDWKRLDKILNEYMSWSGRGGKKKRMFVSPNSQSLSFNPFHRIYRFCIYTEKDIAYFLHMLSALSDCIWLRSNKDSEEEALLEEEAESYASEKKIDDPNLREQLRNAFIAVNALDLDHCSKMILQKGKKIYRPFDSQGEDWNYRLRMVNAIYRGEALTTAELMCFYPDGMPLFSGENNKHKVRLGRLEQYGYLRCKQKKGDQGGDGDKSWEKSELTVQKILDAGLKVNSEFTENFKMALDFYSRFFVLGEIGMFLLDRLGGVCDSPFRFKHEYFMQAVNDYNLIDLLFALEKRMWCRVRYKHGITKEETEILCYPLEIRCSAFTGREFLMCYELFTRSCISLRLDFIEAIDYFKDEDIKEFLHVSPKMLDADIETARMVIQHTWGVSTGPVLCGNAASILKKIKCRIIISEDNRENVNKLLRLLKRKKLNQVESFEADDRQIIFTAAVSSVYQLKGTIRDCKPEIIDEEYGTGCVKTTTVKMNIRYDHKDEYWIGDRLEKEKRRGTWLPEEGIFEVKVTDSCEMRPWVRSFYSKICSCEGMDMNGFSISSDVEDIAEKLDKEKLLTRRLNKQQEYTLPGVPLLFKDHLDSLAEPAQEHNKIFNESHSAYYYVISDAFAELCKKKDDEYVTSEELEAVIKQSIRKYQYMIGAQTEAILTEEDAFKIMLAIHDLLTEKKGTFRTKYVCGKNLNFYRDIVPLSELERRWLRTVLDDSRIGAFLSEQEIHAVRAELLKFDRSLLPLSVDKIYCYDSCLFPEKDSTRENEVLPILLKCIRRCCSVDIEYQPQRRDIVRGTYNPVMIEFSKKDNRFRGFFQSHQDGKVYEMNISQIISAQPGEERFDRTAAMKVFTDFQNINVKSVEIAFMNVRNMADRILTELSPWSKRCVFDQAAGLYRLTLFYKKQDETELVIRMLGYGADIYFTDKNHKICREISQRIKKQEELMEGVKSRNKPNEAKINENKNR